MNTKQESKEIAQTIINQLGGKEFVVLTGSNGFIIHESGVSFRVGANPKKISHCTITLNSGDLYNLIFYSTQYSENGQSLKNETELTDIFCEDLKDVFESKTGLYVSFKPRH